MFFFSVDNNRVTLEGIRGVQGSDYINGSFIDVSGCGVHPRERYTNTHT